jgi:hypothetical protein
VFSSASWVNEAGEIVGAQPPTTSYFTRYGGGVATSKTLELSLACLEVLQLRLMLEVKFAGQSFDSADFSIGRSTLWEQNGPGIDLNVFLPPGSDLTLYEAHFVNDRGQIMAVGVLPNGDQHIIVMVPCSDRESEDCRSARDETAISNKLSTLDAKPSRLNPDSLPRSARG